MNYLTIPVDKSETSEAITVETDDEEEDIEESSVSFLKPSTVNNIDVNYKGEVLVSESIERSVPKSESRVIPFKNNAYIFEFYKKMYPGIEREDYRDFNEAGCFICQWDKVIKKGDSKNDLATYHEIDSNTRNTFESLILKIREDFKAGVHAHDYYITKIYKYYNRLIDSNKDSKLVKFPKSNGYEMYLHATHSRDARDKLEMLYHNHIDICNYISDVVGFFKIDENANRIVDVKVLDMYNKTSNTAGKLFQILDSKKKN